MSQDDRAAGFPPCLLPRVHAAAQGVCSRGGFVGRLVHSLTLRFYEGFPTHGVLYPQGEDAAELLRGAIHEAMQDVFSRGRVNVILRVHCCQPWWAFAGEGSMA